ncbi:MAG: hypothetical protein Ta2F_00930 [Termitinemataceae bacterium]|nr:MAG: hypothetical protein Ta2F_00930 [Termitinemataceae bacterium]
MKSSKNDIFTAAILGPPFALEGFLKVRSLSGEYSHIVNLKSAVIKFALQNTKTNEQAVPQKKTLEIECFKELGADLLVKFKNIDTAEEAKKISGSELLVERAFAAECGKDEYYIEDIKGLNVLNAAGSLLGNIADIVEGGNGSLAEIKLLDGKSKFAPFRDEFFGEIDMENQKIVLLSDWILE